MAKNIIFETSRTLGGITPTAGGATSGAPGLYGDKPFIALTDTGKGGNPTGKCTGQFSGVAEVSVKGVNGSGNSAVAEGDVIYYVDADTPKLSKKASGTRFGVAMGAVTSGGTSTIRVTIG